MINPEKVTQVIVIDYSAKHYPFFELFVSAGPNYDHSSNQCFYTEDEDLIQIAKSKLISLDCREFLEQHLDKVYYLSDAIAKFGKIHSDEMERAVYNAADKSVTLFTPKSTQYNRKVFSNKDDGQFASWIVESEKILATTAEADLIKHTVSVFAFKYCRIYRNYAKQFDRYIQLHDLDIRDNPATPSVLKLIDAINKNKHVLLADMVLDNSRAYLGVNGQKYELYCTDNDYCCKLSADTILRASSCDELVAKLGMTFMQKRLVSVGH